ncbi:hypothetical protein ACFSRY_01170 [Pontibacter locisalis]|uniref:Uncharacterized protein n=1 Tax=Pontibacter locisalis TaxID=1719035 RepID=A0ABW5IFP2_9BACT
MKTIELTETNATLRLDGSEATRSMDIKNITIKKWPATGGHIKMIVLDEKDVPIYSQVLELSEAMENGAVAVNKRFVFYDHLSVQFMTETGEGSFNLVVNFE